MNFRELRIYQIAVKLRDELHSELKSLPDYWKNEDIRQILRSSSSIPSNIAESYGNRFYTKRFLNYINIAIGSSDETQNHAGVLGSDGCLSKERSEYYTNQYKDLSIRIVNYQNYHYKKSTFSN